jgi:hypothetical protein
MPGAKSAQERGEQTVGLELLNRFPSAHRTDTMDQIQQIPAVNTDAPEKSISEFEGSPVIAIPQNIESPPKTRLTRATTTSQFDIFAG